MSSSLRGWLGNAIAIALLVALSLAFLPLHDDAWWQAMPRPTQWWLAAGSVAAYAGLCVLIGAAARRAGARGRGAADSGAVLVLHASQTGFAQALAERTADALVGAGVGARCRALGGVDVATLSAVRRALFVVSTTGEGDPPDAALAFVRDAMAAPAALPQLEYAVLALGDREYAHYCGFGHQLDAWLRSSGARPLFDLVEVDNGDAGALRHWQHHLGRIVDAPELPDWAPAAFDDWTLIARRDANPGSVGGAAFHLALRPAADATLPTWQAGDIAEIGPRHAPADVAAVLQALRLDGRARILATGGETTLTDLLSRSHLPAAISELAPPASAPSFDIAGAADHAPVPVSTCIDPQGFADTLVPLPHREYSIASLPADGTLQLLVRRMHGPDGRAGLGSGWLCEIAAPGDTIALRVRRNANFHPPDLARPMLLIGNGTGIAGLRGHLKVRAAAGSRGAWLLFGERSAAHDAFYTDEIARWHADGTLARVDLVYSRDQPERRYVQHALRDAADRVRRWVADGAAIYVCGSLEGMAPAVDATLRDIIGSTAIDAMLADGRYRRDVY